MGLFESEDFEKSQLNSKTKNIFDDIDKQIKSSNEEPKSLFTKSSVDPVAWIDDMENILSELNFDSNVDLEEYNVDDLEKIESRFGSQSEIINGDGMYQEVDPVPGYCASDAPFDKEIEKLGYAVGLNGTIGRYYKLLPIKLFRKGYFLGMVDYSIKNNDDNNFFKVVDEMKFLDPLGFEENYASLSKDALTGIANFDHSNLDDISKPNILE